MPLLRVKKIILLSSRKSEASRLALYYDRRPIGEHLSDALHHLSGVILDTHNCIGAKLFGVLQHEIEGVIPGFFTEFRQQADVPTDESLQACANGPKHRAGTNNDSANNSERPRDAVAIEFKGCGRHAVGNQRAGLPTSQGSDPCSQGCSARVSICLRISSRRPRDSSRSSRKEITSAHTTSYSSSRCSRWSRRRLASRSAAALASRADFSSSIAL